jgi:hypothetical protein
MKVTLEFEESDLREMLTSYFRGNGFAVKNLDEVCAKFKDAYIDGLKVQAEIMVMDPPIPQLSTVAPPQNLVEDAVDDAGEPDDVAEAAEPMLSLNDLTDPSPRGRVVGIANTKNEFADLINASKRIEQERRRT